VLLSIHFISLNPLLSRVVDDNIRKLIKHQNQNTHNNPRKKCAIEDVQRDMLTRRKLKLN
jgi:hypothetical protein